MDTRVKPWIGSAPSDLDSMHHSTPTSDNKRFTFYYGDILRELVFYVAMHSTNIFRLIENDIASVVIASERLRAEIGILLQSQDQAHWWAAKQYRADDVSEVTRH